MGEVWVISCEYANVANVAAVLTEAMPGAFDFFPAPQEGGRWLIRSSTSSSSARTRPSSHAMASMKPPSLPSRVLKHSPFVLDLDAQPFSPPCRQGARVRWEGRAAKRAGRLDEEPERPRRIALVV
jgi:hypothetical protein